MTEGDEWKRHRKISAPSFSERNNRLVWDETMLIVQELREVLWAGKQEVPVGNIVDLTVPMALFIIGVAGFGKRMSWKKDLSVPEGYVMTFKVGTDHFSSLYVSLRSAMYVSGCPAYRLE